jgi:hypothetical protein
MNLTSWQKVAGQVFRDRADELRAGLEISHVGLRLEGKWTVVAFGAQPTVLPTRLLGNPQTGRYG